MTAVVVLSPEELRAIVRDAVEEAIQRATGPRDPAAPITDEESARARARWVEIERAARGRDGDRRAAEHQAARVARRLVSKRIPRAVRESVLARDGLTCGLCGQPVPADDVHLDHVVPHSRGGETTVENLQVSHSVCNLRKGAGS